MICLIRYKKQTEKNKAIDQTWPPHNKLAISLEKHRYREEPAKGLLAPIIET